MKIAPILATLLLLTPCLRAVENEFLADAPPGYLHLRTKHGDWTEDRYLRNEKVTSVSLVTLSARENPKYQVRISTQEIVRNGTLNAPLILNLESQPKDEAEKLMFQIMNLIKVKD